MKHPSTFTLRLLLAGAVLLLAAPCCMAAGAPKGALRTQVATNLANYAAGVQRLTEQTKLAGSNPPPVITYLSACAEFAQSAAARVPQASDPLAVVEQFAQQRDQRNFELADLLQATASNAPPLNSFPAVRFEKTNLFQRCIAEPLLNPVWKCDTHIRVELFRRKYLDPEEGQANLFEALAQDCPLARFNQERKDGWWSRAGVSAWELKLRLEPVITFGGSTDPALLLSGGLVFNFFPNEFTDTGTVKKETLFSEYVKRTGLCLGGCARFHDGGQTLLVSGGWQIRWVTLWGLFDTAAHEYFFGLGVSEWDWLKNFLPGGLLNLLPK